MRWFSRPGPKHCTPRAAIQDRSLCGLLSLEPSGDRTSFSRVSTGDRCRIGQGVQIANKIRVIDQANASTRSRLLDDMALNRRVKAVGFLRSGHEIETRSRLLCMRAETALLR